MQKSLVFVFGIIAMTLNAQITNKPNYGDNSLVGKYVNIRGIKMYYEIYGTGEPLLLIHGNSGSIADMTNQIEYFSKKYKVIVADSRDHGKTLDTLNMADSLSYEMMADDYNALIKYLKADSAYVIGWSDGGINALLLAMKYPNTVKKIVAMGANLWSDTTAIEPFFYNIFKTRYTMLQKRPMTTENKVMLRHYKIIMTQPNISLEQLKKINCPTMIVAGDHDAIRVQHSALIAQNISNSNLWIAPNAGHGLMVFQYKNKFNEEVVDFFNRKFKKIQGFDLFKN
ncbi:MAG TPA: alpha/beta hydrolase [Sediminibacterium sp.]